MAAAHKIKRARTDDKETIRNLLQLYLYDMTVFEDIPLNRTGLYDYPYLDYYWVEKNRYPYLLYSGKELAGFALVRREKDWYSIAEFFVLRRFRKRGIGLTCAADIIRKRPGRWMVAFEKMNDVGRGFWRKVAESVSGGRIEEGELDGNHHYVRFSTAK